ncbi:hypothetical protein BC835DRAFT_1349665 [Cytidiella melzeri]|nr:hypothetical protein BC835DRAFT_1349665 [Cytidiella melzeri]
MSSKITIAYELSPPKDVAAQGLCVRKTHEITIPGGNSSLRAHYESVREAIAKGKDIIGEELTIWRDVVGDREQFKESKTARPKEDDDEEEEGEGEEEGEE